MWCMTPEHVPYDPAMYQFALDAYIYILCQGLSSFFTAELLTCGSVRAVHDRVPLQLAHDEDYLH